MVVNYFSSRLIISYSLSEIKTTIQIYQRECQFQGTKA